MLNGEDKVLSDPCYVSFDNFSCTLSPTDLFCNTKPPDMPLKLPMYYLNISPWPENPKFGLVNIIFLHVTDLLETWHKRPRQHS